MKRYPFIFITGYFAAGIVLANTVTFNLPVLLFFTFCLFAVSLFVFELKLYTSILVPALIILVSMTYTKSVLHPHRNDIGNLSYYKRSHIKAIEGIVTSDVSHKPFFKTEKTIFTLKVKRVKLFGNFRPAKGKVLVNLFRPENVRYGDLIIVEGKLHRPFTKDEDEAFSYRDRKKTQDDQK